MINTSDPSVVTKTQTYVKSMMCNLDTKYTGYSCDVYQADSSGNNNNGTLNNVAWSQAGASGRGKIARAPSDLGALASAGRRTPVRPGA